MKFLCRLACLLVVSLEPLYGENILLISVDTLRADRLSCYGYRANRTPAIDRWANEGIRFCPGEEPAEQRPVYWAFRSDLKPIRRSVPDCNRAMLSRCW